MSALRADRAVPADRVHRPIGGRPTIDVPGLEQPAHLIAAALSEGDYGHRAVLVVATEDGSMVTGAQLGELADSLESLYGGEAAEGSRAALRSERDELATALAEARGTWAELAAAVDGDGTMPRHRIGDAVHNLRGRAEAAEQALQATRQRLHEVRVAAITGRDGALTDALDQASRLRRELEVASTVAAEANNDADRYARALTDLEQQRDAARRRADHERQARLDLTAMWRADAGFSAERYQQATQAARRRSTAAAALGVLAGAASALTWRFRR